MKVVVENTFRLLPAKSVRTAYGYGVGLSAAGQRGTGSQRERLQIRRRADRGRNNRAIKVCQFESRGWIERSGIHGFGENRFDGRAGRNRCRQICRRHRNQSRRDQIDAGAGGKGAADTAGNGIACQVLHSDNGDRVRGIGSERD